MDGRDSPSSAILGLLITIMKNARKAGVVSSNPTGRENEEEAAETFSNGNLK